MPPKKAGGRKRTYDMAPVIPSGEIVSNFQKKRWKIGKPFATGGFGRLYLAEEVSIKETGRTGLKCFGHNEPS